ncbi:MAG: hypothetical protein FH749_04685 [Firmicutes bacterium]|nr:hypothetical protein [Bacillota bacterium]
MFLTVSLAAFYLLSEYPERDAASGDTRSEWSFESREGWQDQFAGIHVREQWQFAPPGGSLVITATEPLSGLWVLVERTDGDKVEVIEYGVAPQFADLIRSYAVELRDEQLVITPPPFYEVELASFSRDFTEVQFFKGDDPGPDYGGGHSCQSFVQSADYVAQRATEYRNGVC